MTNNKDPNRPCPDCGTTDPAAFAWRLNKSRTAEIRHTRCIVCENKKTTKAKRKYALLNRYGLSDYDAEMMLKSQNGNCGLCGLPPHPGELLHLDHNHSTGKNRGFLHCICNLKLAAVEDEIFKKQAETWLEKHK